LGGFAWQLHHAQALFHICQETGKIPIIYFNNGYYHSPKHGDNWWNYFFKPIQSDKLINDCMLGQKSDRTCDTCPYSNDVATIRAELKAIYGTDTIVETAKKLNYKLVNRK